MELYHYTSLVHLRQILDDGFLKPSPSDLKRPVNLRKEKDERGGWSVVSDTDDYRPVVWAYDKLDFEHAMAATGLDRGEKYGYSSVDKAECALVFDGAGFSHWLTWARKNHISEKWLREMFTDGTDYRHWYVYEGRVYLDDVNARIIFRPDVAERLQRERLQEMTPAERIMARARARKNGSN